MPSRNRRPVNQRSDPHRAAQNDNRAGSDRRSDRRDASKLDTGRPRTGRTDQPRASKAQLTDLRQAAIEQAETLQTSADWLRLLRYAEHFHKYGGTNTLLILRDRPYATRLATYDEWKHDNHPVQRGEHGLTLLDPADPGRTLRLFDIAQTGQAPAPGPLRQVRPARHSAKALRQALTSIAMRKKYDVITHAPEGRPVIGARTAFAEHTIHLHPDLTEDAACYALAHELAHVLLHGPERLDPVTGACNGLPLVEAESVAYLLCRNAGLDVTPFTFADPPTWAGTDPRVNPGAKILTAIDRITTTAHKLITRVDTIDPDPGQPALTAVRKTQPTIEPAPTEQAKATTSVQEPEPHRDPRLVDIHRSAEQFFIARLPGSWVPGYLAGRGLAAALEPEAPWGIGYAPATWTELIHHLHASGYTDEEIITSGLGKRSRKGGLIDRFRDRAMLPVRDPDGTTIAFIGRANPSTPSTRDRPIPKYINSPQTPLYTKGAFLYGLDQALPRLRAGAIPVLVEGTLDAIAIHIADPDRRYAPVAPSGTALTTEQVTAISHAVNLHERSVLVAFDGDPAGQRAAARAHRLLHPRTHRLHQAKLSLGDDPAGLLENHGPHHLLTALSNRRPLAVAILDVHLAATSDHPEWQRREEAAQLIAELTPPDKIRQLAEANRPSPHSAPANTVFLPAARAADLLPYVTKALILHAADAIGTPITDQITALVEASSEQARKVPSEHADHDQAGGPADLAARDGPASPTSLPTAPVPASPPRAPQSSRPPAKTR